MRRAARVDRNQAEIVEALRAIGATVQPLHTVGKGCPDLAVGFRGATFLLEVKDGERNRHKLTEDERTWIDGWRGQVDVVVDVVDALAAVGAVVSEGSDLG